MKDRLKDLVADLIGLAGLGLSVVSVFTLMVMFI